MSELRIMGRPGDTKVIWDKANADEVKTAKRAFDELVKKRFLAFSVKGKNGDKDQRIYEFDPDAEKVILVPPMQGG